MIFSLFESLVLVRQLIKKNALLLQVWQFLRNQWAAKCSALIIAVRLNFPYPWGSFGIQIEGREWLGSSMVCGCRSCPETKRQPLQKQFE